MRSVHVKYPFGAFKYGMEREQLVEVSAKTQRCDISPVETNKKRSESLLHGLIEIYWKTAKNIFEKV